MSGSGKAGVGSSTRCAATTQRAPCLFPVDYHLSLETDAFFGGLHGPALELGCAQRTACKQNDFVLNVQPLHDTSATRACRELIGARVWIRHAVRSAPPDFTAATLVNFAVAIGRAGRGQDDSAKNTFTATRIVVLLSN